MIRISKLLFIALAGVLSYQISSQDIDDFSRLNNTRIHKLFTPGTTEEIQDILNYAHRNGLKVSVSGVRHSQGGHAFYPNGVVIDLKNYNKVLLLDKQQKTITVQAGITWNEIQEYLNPHDLAVKVMQFANIFSVGGSLSVNANGIDPHCMPLIETVRSFKIVVSDGAIVCASRTENSELFHLAIGGYGLFGIILEVTLDVVENSFYLRDSTSVTLDEYVTFVKSLPKRSDIGFHFGFIKLPFGRNKQLTDVVVFNFKTVDKRTIPAKKQSQISKLHQERFVRTKRIGTGLWTKSRLLKSFHWVHEWLKKGIVSRNNIMRPPASHLFIEPRGETNLLQEYFIPVDNLITFLRNLEKITSQLNQNLIHVAVRFIPKNTESFLSYSRSDCIGIVLFVNQKMSTLGNAITKAWTQQLIDTANALDGTYYLPIQLHADQKQIRNVYPQIDTFFRYKKQYDPTELFMNTFYKKYTSMN